MTRLAFALTQMLIASSCVAAQIPQTAFVESPSAGFVRYWEARLEQHPEPHVWRQFSAALLKWRSLGPPQIAQLDHALRDWPDRLRRAPDSWEPLDEQPLELPGWSLVRALEITAADAPRFELPLRHLDTVAHARVDGPQALRALASSDAIPKLDSVEAVDVDLESLRALAGARGAQLVSLDLWENNLGDELTSVLNERNWPKLERLDVGANRIGPQAAHAIAALEAPRLLELSLAFNPLGDDGLQAALSTPRELVLLNLRAVTAGPASVRALAAIGTRQLESLDLSDNPLADDGVIALTELSLGRLRVLRLNAVGMGPAGSTALSAVLGPEVQVLELGRNELHDAGVAPLCENGMTGVRFLNLDAVRLTNHSARVLARCTQLSKLQSLSLHNNGDLDADGIQSLADASFGHLTAIGLDGCNIGNAGLVALSKAKWWRQLTHLRIEANQITDDGIRAVFRNPPPRLQNLGLGWNELAIGASDGLATAAFPHLRTLSLRGNALDDAALRRLLEAVWLTHLEELDLRALAFDGLNLSLEAIATRLPRGAILRREQ